MTENICRLCLNLVKKQFELIDAETRQMLQVLSLKVDLDASINPIICKVCTKLAKKSYFFKSVCMDTEKLILSYYSTTQERSKFDMKDVYEDSKGVKIIVEDFSICCYCMQQTLRHNCVSINVLMSDMMYKKMLPIVMPEKIQNIINDPVICTSCRENLDSYFEFIKNCFDTEEKISKYRQNGGSSSQIKLSNVLSFMYKNILTHPDQCSQIALIKQENLFEDMNVSFDMHDEQIKCEVLDIKYEANNFEEILFKTPLEVTTDKCETYDTEENNKSKLEVLNDKTKREGNIRKRNILKVSRCKNKERGEMYSCATCNYETRYKKHLETHMLVHKTISEIETHKCEICCYETSRKRNLNRHMLRHKVGTEVKMYKCTICTFETKHKTSHKAHMLLHRDVSEVEMYKCEICSHETRHKHLLKRHMLIHRASSEVEWYKCGICSHETIHKQLLKAHMLTHKDTSEVEIYECGICTFNTKYKRCLKRHMLIHKGASETSKNGSDLADHMLRDTSEVEMHKCEECNFKTKYKHGLKSHTLTHKDASEVMMYKCGECTYETKYKVCLKNHYLIHRDTSEVEMYKCTMCTFETKHKNSYKSHMLQHKDTSEVKMYKCEICSHETRRKYHLKCHMLRRHKHIS